MKQYLTEKRNGYLQNGHLRKVVARRELTVPHVLATSFEKRMNTSLVSRNCFCNAILWNSVLSAEIWSLQDSNVTSYFLRLIVILN